MLFLSYSRRNTSFISVLLPFLRLSHAAVWVDFEYLDLSLPLEPQIRAALCDSSDVLLVRSPAVDASHWIRFEMAEAARCGRRIFELNYAPHLDPSAWYSAERRSTRSNMAAYVATGLARRCS